MRIAFHFPTLASGGVEKMRIALARELLARGIEVDFVLCQAKGEYLDQVPAGVRLHDLRARRTRHSLVPLIRYLKQQAPDYLVSSLGPQNIIAVLAKHLSGASTRVFVTQHNVLSQQAKHDGPTQQRLVPFAYRWALPRADGVIAVSDGIARDIAVSTGFPRSRIAVIHNPAYLDASIDLRPLPEWLAGKQYILSIGRMVRSKAFDDLIRAFALVRARVPELHLVILGVGPLQSELSALVAELGLAGNVHLPGFANNPVTYLRGARLFAMSSRYEGFGNVLVEALSAGTPIVSTDCDFGPSEILATGEFGRLVPVGDIQSLADAIEATLRRTHDAAKLQARAKQFSVDAIVDQYLSLLRSRGRTRAT